MAAKRYNYLLSKELDTKRPVPWTTYQFKDDLRKGQKVLLMQILGSSSHPLRGIYGVGVIEQYSLEKPSDNVDIRYTQKFPQPIHLHSPLPKKVLQILNQLKTPKLFALLTGKAEAQRNLQPIYREDIPYINKAIGLLQKSLEGSNLPEDQLVAAAKEGRKLTRIHLRRERKRKVIDAAKSIFMNRHGGRLYCSACGFDFLRTYGERGYGFIEGHHILPLSKLKAETETRPEDIAILCSNCHRMLHNRQPWITVGKLKTLLRNNR